MGRHRSRVVLFCAEVEQVSESDTAKQLKYWVDVEGSENHRAQLDLIAIFHTKRDAAAPARVF